MGNSEALKKKRNLLIFTSIVAGVTAIGIFFILGGGSGEEAKAEEADTTQTQGLNSDIAVTDTTAVTDDKESAMSEEEQRKRAFMETDGDQDNSFAMLENMKKQSSEDNSADELQKRIDQEKRTMSAGSGGSETPVRTAQRKVAMSSDNNDAYWEKWKAAKKEEQMERIKARYGVDPRTGKIVTSQSAPAKAQAKATAPAPAKPVNKRKGFNGLGGSSYRSNGHDIRAVVHGAQKNLTTNSIVKLRLLDPLTINGVVVPKNSFVYGRVSFSDSRMQITVDNINYRDNVLPFRGQIYDKDGFRGIYVPDNAIADAGKEGKSSTIDDQNTDFSTQHASTSLVGVGVTAVNSLGRAAKKAISKSASKTRVNIAANYLITIREVE